MECANTNYSPAPQEIDLPPKDQSLVLRRDNNIMTLRYRILFYLFLVEIYIPPRVRFGRFRYVSKVLLHAIGSEEIAAISQSSSHLSYADGTIHGGNIAMVYVLYGAR